MKEMIILLVVCIVQAIPDTCLHNKNLVIQNTTTSDIINNHETICDEDIKHFPNIVIGHITPYYNRGKELAVKYAKKFDVISPVWFIIEKSNDSYIIKGKEHYDKKFIEEIREANSQVKIIPRYLFDRSTILYFHQQSVMYHGEFIETMSKHIEEYNFDGIELEVSGYILSVRSREYFVDLINLLGRSLHYSNKTLIITIYVHRSLTQPLFDLELFEELGNNVDYYNLLTNNYYTNHSHSPIQWLKSVIKNMKETAAADKFLIELTFSAYSESVTGIPSTVECLGLDFLREEPTYTLWNEATEEHLIIKNYYQGNEYKEIIAVIPSLYVNANFNGVVNRKED